MELDFLPRKKDKELAIASPLIGNTADIEFEGGSGDGFLNPALDAMLQKQHAQS